MNLKSTPVVKTIAAIVAMAGMLVAQTGTPIPLQVSPPTIANPLDTARRILELREIQEQTRQLQEQTRQIEEQRAASQRQQEAEKQRVPSAGGLNLTMKQLLGEDGFRLTGLYLLRSEQVSILDKWISLYSADLARRFSSPVREAVESEIKGFFNGWSGETIFELTNGQIWKQSAYDYQYESEFNPKVVIYPIGSTFKMRVDGVKGAIEVRQIK